MKDKIKSLVNKKYFIVILIIVLMALVVVAGTYAWFTWQSTENTTLTMTIGEIASVTFDGGPDINTSSLAPVFYYNEGEVTNISITNKATSSVTFNIGLSVTSISNELKSSSFKYVLVDASNNQLATGNLMNASNNNTLDIYSGTLPSGVSTYKFYIYIDANMENSLDMMNYHNFKATLTVGATGN